MLYTGLKECKTNGCNYSKHDCNPGGRVFHMLVKWLCIICTHYEITETDGCAANSDTQYSKDVIVSELLTKKEIVNNS